MHVEGENSNGNFSKQQNGGNRNRIKEPMIQKRAHLSGRRIESGVQQLDEAVLEGDEAGATKHEQRAQHVQVVCHAACQRRREGGNLPRTRISGVAVRIRRCCGLKEQ